MALAFSRILLAYDDSAGSQIALEYACALTRAGATLTVAHAVNESVIVSSATTTSGFAAIDPTPLIEALDDRGTAVLKAAADACATHGVAAEQVFLRESAGAGVVELGRAREVDLIVAGTHGRQGVARAVLGSVAEDILRSSDVPVLVVTGHARSPRHDHLFRRALVALDASDPSRTAMSVAARLYLDLATHLTLCHVIDSRKLPPSAATDGFEATPIETDLHAASLELLERAAKTSNVAASVDDLAVVKGEPAAAIEHTAMQRNCDLIVVGSHGRHGFERRLLGSVAEAVVRSSTLPVLVTPAGRGTPKNEPG